MDDDHQRSGCEVGGLSSDSAVRQRIIAHRTPIGNDPGATLNGVNGKIFFPSPKSSSPLVAKYDNVDGDVHFTWSADGYDGG